MGSPNACRRTSPCGVPPSISAWHWEGKAPRQARPLSREPAPFCDHPLESHLHAAIEGDRLQGRDRARINREGDRRRQLRISAGIEECTIGRVPVVEDIVDESEELHVLVHLVGGVEVRHPIERQLGVLVGVVAYKILGAGDENIGTELEFWRDHNVAAELHLVARNAGDMVARHHEYVSTYTERIVWRG